MHARAVILGLCAVVQIKEMKAILAKLRGKCDELRANEAGVKSLAFCHTFNLKVTRFSRVYFLEVRFGFDRLGFSTPKPTRTQTRTIWQSPVPTSLPPLVGFQSDSLRSFCKYDYCWPLSPY